MARRSKTSLRKSSSGDTIIRDLFKYFLRQIEFYSGGAFFLTADKSNAALAQAEGLHSVYIKQPTWQSASDRIGLKECIRCNRSSETITKSVSIGKLIYELTVQFGKIRISWLNSSSRTEKAEISCDSEGESLEHWFFKDLMMTKSDAGVLMKNYNGRFPLKMVKNTWQELRSKLVKSDIY